MPERLECEVLQKSALYKYTYLLTFLMVVDMAVVCIKSTAVKYEVLSSVMRRKSETLSGSVDLHCEYANRRCDLPNDVP